MNNKQYFLNNPVKIEKHSENIFKCYIGFKSSIFKSSLFVDWSNPSIKGGREIDTNTWSEKELIEKKNIYPINDGYDASIRNLKLAFKIYNALKKNS